MNLYRFSYRQINRAVPLSVFKTTWSRANMDEAVQAARDINDTLKDAKVWRIEDIKSGETVEL